MTQKPRNTKESLFDKLLMQELIISGIVISLIVFFVWYLLINIYHMEVNHARGYIMALMVFIQNLHVLNCRSEHKSVFKYSIKENPFVIFSIVSSIILQVIIMEVEPLSRLLSTYRVPYQDLFKLILAAIPIIIAMELFKKFNKTKEKKN